MSVCKPGDACMLAKPNCEHGNVAQCKKASQSTTRNGMTAIKATDGEETMALTKCENNPWWEVDLETRREVSEVVVMNRRDCCWEQLNGLLVELKDAFGNTIYSVQHDPATMGEINNVWSVDIPDVEHVLFVRVSTQQPEGECMHLDLVEVQVMAKCELGDACLTGDVDCENKVIA